MTATHPSPLRAPTSIRARAVSVVTLLVVLLLPAGTASAHTSFEQSTPANGETIAEPADVIILEFTGVSEPADDGFTVLDSVANQPFRDVREYAKFHELIPVSEGSFFDKV